MMLTGMGLGGDGRMSEYLVNPVSLIVVLLVTEARLLLHSSPGGMLLRAVSGSLPQVINAALLATSEVECMGISQVLPRFRTAWL